MADVMCIMHVNNGIIKPHTNEYYPELTEPNIPLNIGYSESPQESSKKSPLVYSSENSGKEELDIIDGISIYSFVCETDLSEFSKVQSNLFGVQDVGNSHVVNNADRIIPTKTRDITKIKGWRNKIFTFNNYLNDNQSNLANGIKCSQHDASQEVNSNSFSSNAVKNEQEILKLPDLQNGIPKLKEEPVPEIIDNVPKDLKSLYFRTLGEDKVLLDITKKKSNLKETEGVFQSNLLDDYLQNHSNLNISFDIPRPSSYNHHLSTSRITKNLVRDKKYEEKIKKLLSTDFLKNGQGDTTKRKCIMVHGMPIKLEQISNNNFTKKRSYDNFEESMIEKSDDENFKKIKIEKLPLSDDESMDYIEGDSKLLEVKEEKSELELPIIVKEEDIEDKKNIPFNPPVQDKLSVFVPCLTYDEDHSKCALFTKMQLAMIVNLGYKRPLKKYEMDNLEKLKKENVIDDLWANIAASAVSCKNTKKTVNRFLLPVVTEALIKTAKLNIETPSTSLKHTSFSTDTTHKSIESVQVNDGLFKSRREKKLPARYRNNVLLGKEMHILSPHKSSEDNHIKLISPSKMAHLHKYKYIQKMVKDGKINSAVENLTKEEEVKINVKEAESLEPLEIESNKSGLRVRSLSDLRGKPQLTYHPIIKKVDPKPHQIFSGPRLFLSDVFVWCSTHFRYSCNCATYVFFMKMGRLVWKPTLTNTLTSKQMSQIAIDNSLPPFHFYDETSHSARTFGSIINYTKRNKSLVFKTKRQYDIANSFFCSTNSFVKIDIIKHKYQSKERRENSPIHIKSLTPEERNILKTTPEAKDNIQKTPTFIIQNDRGEVIVRNKTVNKDRKKYRIGPAHFNKMGNYNNVKRSTMFRNNDDKLNLAPSFDKEPGDDHLPNYGLLCINPGIGYLPVKNFTSTKLELQDPLTETVYHCFKDITSANKWLNKFFKNRMTFESPLTKLKWVIVKPGILKQSKPFDKRIFEDSNKIINKRGSLVDISSNEIKAIEEGNSSKEDQFHGNGEVSNYEENSFDISGNSKEIIQKTLNKAMDNPPTNIFTKNSILKKKFIIKSQNNLQEKKQDLVSKSNHSHTFRLSNNVKQAEGCFIPLVPSGSNKRSLVIKNAIPLKKKKSILISDNSNNKDTLISKEINLKNAGHITKTIPFNIKPLPGKSLLKRNFK